MASISRKEPYWLTDDRKELVALLPRMRAVHGLFHPGASACPSGFSLCWCAAGVVAHEPALGALRRDGDLANEGSSVCSWEHTDPCLPGVQAQASGGALLCSFVPVATGAAPVLCSANRGGNGDERGRAAGALSMPRAVAATFKCNSTDVQTPIGS